MERTPASRLHGELIGYQAFFAPFAGFFSWLTTPGNFQRNLETGQASLSSITGDTSEVEARAIDAAQWHHRSALHSEASANHKP